MKFIWKFSKQRKAGSFLRILLFALFLAYFYCVLEMTILSRRPGHYGGIDWRILAKWKESDWEKAFFISNVLMFVPFGFLLPMLANPLRNVLVAFPIGMFTSVAIEGIQLWFQLGYCQLDDVFANMLGFLAGFIVIWIGSVVVYWVNRLKCL